ncbi:MAG TPA: hypothetical protein VKV77_09850 [Methylovirgula sp.]|nr:hypothetical protein [Methylovirgula sp.]
MSLTSDEQFKKSRLSIQDMLQAVEDVLLELGFEDYVVATERGTFRWQTIERAVEQAVLDLQS